MAFLFWLADMTSLEPLRNSQRDFSSSVTLKYIMLQSRGLQADTRSVNEVMLRRIAVIKSSVVFNLKIARVMFSFVHEKRISGFGS